METPEGPGNKGGVAGGMSQHIPKTRRKQKCDCPQSIQLGRNTSRDAPRHLKEVRGMTARLERDLVEH